MTKNWQEAKMKEIQVKSRSRKNRTVCFFYFGVFGFCRTDRVRLGFEI
jgi:hypothetical protein